MPLAPPLLACHSLGVCVCAISVGLPLNLYQQYAERCFSSTHSIEPMRLVAFLCVLFFHSIELEHPNCYTTCANTFNGSIRYGFNVCVKQTPYPHILPVWCEWISYCVMYTVPFRSHCIRSSLAAFECLLTISLISVFNSFFDFVQPRDIKKNMRKI